MKNVKNAKPLLQHILQSIAMIEEYSAGKSFPDFEDDTELQDAVIRRMEIVGEAAKNLPVEFRLKYPSIEWKKAAGMRDLLAHQYFSVDLKVLWETIHSDLPYVKREVEKILENLKEQE